MHPPAPAAAPVVETTTGRVVGTTSEGVLLYAGIPFAAPPVGPRRFAAPKTHPGWTGVHDATAFGPMAMQTEDQRSFPGGGTPPRDENCLYLNVQTPAVGDERRPVLVVLHGGGFQDGAGSMSPSNGAAFARDGDVVVVTPNYRLGVFGWLHLAHRDDRFVDSTNAGLLDQLLALRWVQDNIAAFGGDPDRVTLLGLSSGAMSATTLMALPTARGLFHRVVAHSGTPRFTNTLQHGLEVADRLLATLGLDSPHELLAVDPERLLDAQGTVRQEISIARALRPNARFFLTFGPVVDGATLPGHPLDAFAHGGAANVPLLIGANRDEWNWFATLAPPQDDRAVIAERLGAYGAPEPDALLDTYVGLTGSVTGAWSAIQTDRLFRVPAGRLADEHQGHGRPAYQYLFSWPSPAPGIGACHALEVPFAFATLHQLDLGWYTGSELPTDLELRMHRAWTAFIHTGNPGHDDLPDWPTYGEARSTMVFDEECRVVEDPEAERRRAWDGIF